MLVRYLGKLSTYSVVGTETGQTYRFRARGTELMMDERDFANLQYEDSRWIRQSGMGARF